ncbi:conjugative relaxase [Metakosakonia massiliensis]|uniref:Multifunctional conjugation protein TraI n=1 Tax=Phytobacter massiliensis TaxID=1485952 RepID=A0A6N3E709_9ENTR
MMSVAPIASAGDAAAYYGNKDNYYFLGQLESEWLGEGASELGLEGPVRSDTLTAVLEGRLPDGARLGKEINGNHVHRAGHDLTFSAPKSVSILALIGGDKAMLEAHQHAVRVAATYVEKLISARETVDGKTSIVPTGKMVAALFTHDTSRNLDPQLHTHMLVANMTELNGKWKALATDKIHDAGFIETVMKMQVTLGKIYRNTLKADVEALGHEVEEVGAHGMWEIKGVPADIREEYSSRGREIQGSVGAEATLRSRDVAAKDTRQAKVDPSRLRLMERWIGQMTEKGWNIREYQAGVVPREPVHTSPAPRPERTENAIPGQAAPASPSYPGHQERNPQEPDRGGEPGREKEAGFTRPASGVPSLTQAVAPDIRPEVADAVRMAISQLSDSKTRFTWGELMLSTTEFSDKVPDVKELKAALNVSLSDGLIVPLDSEKGVFTSRNHLLDELSIQALSKDHLQEARVVSFRQPAEKAPAMLSVVEKDPLVLMNAPKGVAGIRELTEQITAVSASHGRRVQVLASSAERVISLSKSDRLRDRLIGRQQVLSGEFSLTTQSTLIIEGAERLGLKETLVLLGEAREKGAQLIFLDSAGRQANGNAMSVLESAGVSRSRRTEPAPGFEAAVVSIADKRDRYEAMATRYAELSAGSEPVTAIVIGQREQKHMTGLIRDALQNAGQLERDGVTIEARTPVWLDNKTRRMAGSYRAGQVLEDRSEKETRHYVIGRVHDDTRMLSLIDSDGVLSRQKMGDLTADWRLYNSENLSVVPGEKLIAMAADKPAGLKAKDRLTVTAISEKGIEALRDGKKIVLPADRPLYVSHAYVASPGNRDNESGTVLAALNSRDITTQTINSLAQSGDKAEIFTAEAQDRAEARMQRMRTDSSPLQLVSKLSGEKDADKAVAQLRSNVKSEAALAVHRAIADQQGVMFDELKLAEAASDFHPDMMAIDAEITGMVKRGDLIRVPDRANPVLVARATWEMEKAIISAVTEGKDTQTPLLEQVDPLLLDGLTTGQKAGALLVLGSRDQFTGIQGYAGVGKTTQVRAVKAALDTLPETSRPQLLGLAPTHQAVKELKDVGIEAQTAKSFIVDHEQLLAAGEKPDYRNQVFLMDESSMLGNQDMAAVYQAIKAGGGRGVSMGDIDQFEAIESGAPFKLVQERSPMDVAIMKQIVRQNEANLKNAVHDIIDNRIDAALTRLAAQPQDKVTRAAASDFVVPEKGITDAENPAEAVVEDWLSRTPDARARTLIIAQLNADRQAINAGIYAGMAARQELGDKAITLPVLDKITHTRHAFNKTKAWSAGMVLKRGDAWQDVIAVDRNGSMVTVKDEDGKLGLYSPRELLTGDVELFTRSQMEVRAGTEVRFTLTDRNRGQTANARYTVDAIHDNGDVVLKGASGTKVINPAAVRAEQNIDYAWAVTGYGSQGASSDYVISLEGTEGGRQYMATKRAFYISASRTREHVQIYTDGTQKWLDAVKKPESSIKTAHDALKPETERKQARLIWAMGQPVTKTAIGRAWSRHEGVDGQRLSARIIPATKRFPEPAMALPLYDNNGKTAGLALVSLVAGDNGRLMQGTVRMVATEGATGAVLQRSESGNTQVVKDLAGAIKALQDHPRDGVVWQTGDARPSPWMLKVSKGTEQNVDAARAQAVKDGMDNVILPPVPPGEKEPDMRAAVISAGEALTLQRQAGEELASRHAQTLNKPAERENIIIPPEIIPDLPVIPPEATRSPEHRSVDKETIARIAAAVRPEPEVRPDISQTELPDRAKDLQDLSRTAERVAGELAERKREEVTLPQAPQERGRTLEHEELTRTHTLQKER